MGLMDTLLAAKVRDRTAEKKDRKDLEAVISNPAAKSKIDEAIGTDSSKLSGISALSNLFDLTKKVNEFSAGQPKTTADIAESGVSATAAGATQTALDKAVGKPHIITNFIDQAGNQTPIESASTTPYVESSTIAGVNMKYPKPATVAQTEASQKQAESKATTMGSKTGEMDVTRQKFQQDFQTYQAFVDQINFTTGGLEDRIKNKGRLMLEGANGKTVEGVAYNQTLAMSRQLAPTIRRLSMDVGNATGWEQQGAMKLLIDGSETKMMKNLKMATLRDLTRAINSGDQSAVKNLLDSYIRSEQFKKTYGDWENNPLVKTQMDIETFTQDKLAAGVDPNIVEEARKKLLAKTGVNNGR